MWWRKGVWERLYDYQRRNIPASGSFGELVDSLDIANCLLLIDINWRGIFGNELSRDCLSWIKELKNTRNSWAHFGGKRPTSRDTWRALDTMSRLLQEIDQDAFTEIENLIGQIEPEMLMPPIGTEPVTTRAESLTTDSDTTARSSDSQKLTRTFMPKREWTPSALADAISAWCIENGRAPLSGFEDLDFFEAAEAALAMPALSNSVDNTFRNSADNIVFQINDAKMMAITHLQGKEAAYASMSIDARETQADGAGPLPSIHEQLDACEQFAYLPKKKVSWARDDILNVADSWASTNSRILPAQTWRWRLDTLADMVLSKLPEQSDPSTGFHSSLPETLFAPDTRKLQIVTHQ